VGTKRGPVGTQWGPSGAMLGAPGWFTRSPHVAPTRSPRGPHAVPTSSPRGPHVVRTWSPRGLLTDTRWAPRWDHVRAKWGPRGDHVGTTRRPRGDQVGANLFPDVHTRARAFGGTRTLGQPCNMEIHAPALKQTGTDALYSKPCYSGCSVRATPPQPLQATSGTQTHLIRSAVK